MKECWGLSLQRGTGVIPLQNVVEKKGVPVVRVKSADVEVRIGKGSIRWRKDCNPDQQCLSMRKVWVVALVQFPCDRICCAAALWLNSVKYVLSSGCCPITDEIDWDRATATQNASAVHTRPGIMLDESSFSQPVLSQSTASPDDSVMYQSWKRGWKEGNNPTWWSRPSQGSTGKCREGSDLVHIFRPCMASLLLQASLLRASGSMRRSSSSGQATAAEFSLRRHERPGGRHGASEILQLHLRASARFGVDRASLAKSLGLRLDAHPTRLNFKHLNGVPRAMCTEGSSYILRSSIMPRIT